ncbi:transcription factor bHLH121 [Pyrus x bretschneideri]|uniref:transcription factor bHLH121 n=1 Tax=Pyrus x bretschneideri TaxID=225117 RepID=UPI00202E8F28|nr:transcription factor bHLH121 [Pyrus x bretschneideri]XP_009346633.2 transcription factor bHLH121 [Pyrus x bretschneideri]XP_048420312.1 transcription factor bHLH121 [Pyrus x bretschneideri]
MPGGTGRLRVCHQRSKKTTFWQIRFALYKLHLHTTPENNVLPSILFIYFLHHVDRLSLSLMDQLKHEDLNQSAPPPFSFAAEFPQPASDRGVPPTRSQPNSSQRPEGEVKDCLTARKIQKADREKLRRDRLNEQFLELGNVLDPDRPKNDKATIIADTIQVLKDLTLEVDKLKSECVSLTEESRELTHEKNDLREEKASLKSDIENLNAQYQQRLRTMFPWGAMDHSVVMAPPSYPYPMPMTMPMPMPMQMPARPMPVHPHMQPYHYFGNQNPGVIPNPCSTYLPYITPNTLVEQQSTQYISPIVHPGSQSQVSGKQDAINKSPGESQVHKSDDSIDVTTELELKTPGSTSDQDLSSVRRKSKKSARLENREGSSSSRCSSSRSVQDSSSNSVVGGKKADD